MFLALKQNEATMTDKNIRSEQRDPVNIFGTTIDGKKNPAPPGMLRYPYEY